MRDTRSTGGQIEIHVEVDNANLARHDLEKPDAIFAGKAHPQDREGKELIQRIFASRNPLRKEIRIAYLSHYDMDMAKLIVVGSDVWLNTPEPPMEASGTSGMKAALNGAPSLSILDGWWIEGHIEGVTGWAIGEAASANDNPQRARTMLLPFTTSSNIQLSNVIITNVTGSLKSCAIASPSMALSSIPIA
jgi:glucan phosphorylase